MLKKIDMNAIEPEVFSPLMTCEDAPKPPKKSKKKTKEPVEAAVTPVDGIMNTKEERKPKLKIKLEKQMSPRSPPLSGHGQKQKQKQQSRHPPQQELSFFEKLKQDPNYVSFDKEADQGELYIVVLRLAKTPTESIPGTERIMKLKSGETIQNIKKKLLDNGSSGGGRFGFSDISMFMDGKELINPFSLVDVPKISQEKKADINVVIKCDPPLTSLPLFKAMSSVPAESSSKEDQLEHSDRQMSPPPQLPLQKQQQTKHSKQPLGSGGSKGGIKLNLGSVSKSKDSKIRFASPADLGVKITLHLVKSPEESPSDPGQDIFVQKGDNALTIKKAIVQSIKSNLGASLKSKNVELYANDKLLNDKFASFESNSAVKVVIKKCSQQVTELPTLAMPNPTLSTEAFSPRSSTAHSKQNKDENASQSNLKESINSANNDETAPRSKSKISLQKQQPPQQELSFFEKLKQDPNYVSFDKEADQGELYIVVLRLAKTPTESIPGTERIMKLKSGETIQNIKKKLLDNGSSGGGRFGFSDISMFMDGKELINPFSLVDVPKISQEKKADINVVIKCDPPLTSLPLFKAMSSVPAESSSKEDHLEHQENYLEPPQIQISNKKKKSVTKKTKRKQRVPSSSSYSSFSSSQFSGSKSSSYSSSRSSFSGSSKSSSYYSRSSRSSFSGSSRSSGFSSVGSGFALDIPDHIKKSNMSEMKTSMDNSATRTGEDNELRRIYELKHKEGNSTRRSRTSSDTNISRSEKDGDEEDNPSSSSGGVDIDVDDDGDSSYDPDGFAKESKSQATPEDRSHRKQKKYPKDSRRRDIEYSDSELSDFGSSYGSSYSRSYSSKFSTASSSSTMSSARSMSSSYSSRSSSASSTVSSTSRSSSSFMSSTSSTSSRSDDGDRSPKKDRGRRRRRRSKTPQRKNSKRKTSGNRMEYLVSELEFTYNHTKKTAQKRIKKLKKEVRKKDRIIESLKSEREIVAKTEFMTFTPPPMVQPNEIDPSSHNANIPLTARYKYNQVPPPISISQQTFPATSTLMKTPQSTFMIPQATTSVSTVQNPIAGVRSGLRSPTVFSPTTSLCGSSKSNEDGVTINESYNSNMMIINMLNNDKQQLLNDKQALISQLFERNREYDLLKERYEALKKKYDDLKYKK